MTRLEKHILNVAVKQERYQRELTEMSRGIDDRTKKMIWGVVLEGAKNVTCTPCENMISLIRAHHALFSNEATTREETPSLNTQKEP